jgi:hypothetical protein
METYPQGELELARYLAGYPEYAIVNRYADTPTDPELALKPIIARIKDDPSILDTLHAALILLSQDREYGWMAMYYMFELIYAKKSLDINWLPQEVVAKIGKSLLTNREKFSEAKVWMGAGFEKGLWGDVLRMNRNIQEECGIVVLSEE